MIPFRSAAVAGRVSRRPRESERPPLAAPRQQSAAQRRAPEGSAGSSQLPWGQHPQPSPVRLQLQLAF